MKILILLVGLVVLSSCIDNADGTPFNVERKCINGVSYYISKRRMAPVFKPDSTVETCTFITNKIENGRQ